MDILREAELSRLRWGRADGVIVRRSEVVSEARRWLGTLHVHQGDSMHGTDCGGLVRGVSVALGLIPSNYLELTPESLRGYERRATDDLGMRLCDHYWKRIPKMQIAPGDVVLIHWKASGIPQHCGIVGDYKGGGLSLIHALGKVIEHNYSDAWRGRVLAAYSLPGVA